MIFFVETTTLNSESPTTFFVIYRFIELVLVFAKPDFIAPDFLDYHLKSLISSQAVKLKYKMNRYPYRLRRIYKTVGKVIYFGK